MVNVPRLDINFKSSVDGTVGLCQARTKSTRSSKDLMGILVQYMHDAHKEYWKSHGPWILR